VLECGIGTNDPARVSSMGAEGRPGASLRVWRDYFPAARIIGIDIDDSILFTEERIETHAVDQTSAESIRLFVERLPPEAMFDIVIDDGLHTPEAAFSLFAGLSHRLAQDGLWVIEDVPVRRLARYAEVFRRAAPGFALRAFVLHRRGSAVGDNCLLVATRDEPAAP